MSKISRLVFAVAVATLGSQAAFAGDLIKDANNQIQFSVSRQHTEYYELDTFKATNNWWLDSEKGSQNGFALKGSAQTTAFGVPDVYASFEFSHYRGHTQYDGYLQGGATLIPYQTTTSVENNDYQLKLGKGLRFNGLNNVQLTPYLTYGHSDWERDSSADKYGYREVYQHGYYGVGLLAQAQVADNVLVHGDYMTGRTLGPHMLLDDGTRFNLGEKSVSSASVGLTYSLDKNWKLTTEYRQVRFDYGISPVVGKAVEPNSRTTRDMVSVGVGYSF